MTTGKPSTSPATSASDLGTDRALDHDRGLDLDHALRVAIHAAEEAARIQREHLGGDLDIATKSSVTDLVTQVDRACETRIRDILRSAFPDHAVLGEEQGQQGDARHRWIVDPVDGTMNFAHGFPYFCVSIALEADGETVVGVVLDTPRDVLYQAVRGRGASANGRPIQVSAETEPIQAMLASAFVYHPSRHDRALALLGRMLPAMRAVRRTGSSALDLCQVASGTVDAFAGLNLKPWDVAAGLLILEEAGGTVTAADGTPYRVGEEAILASNGHLHNSLVGLLDLAGGAEA